MNRKLKIGVIIFVIVTFIMYSIWWYINYTKKQDIPVEPIPEPPKYLTETPAVKKQLTTLFRKKQTPVEMLVDDESLEQLEEFVETSPEILDELVEEPMRLEEFVNPDDVEEMLDALQEIRYEEIGAYPVTACILGTNECQTIEVESFQDAITHIFFEDGTMREAIYSECDETGYCFTVDIEGDEWEMNYFGGTIEDLYEN
ncbi:MAG: hypothetical protein ABII02_00080 [Candidatus Magasanikbacteria bacterium]